MTGFLYFRTMITIHVVRVAYAVLALIMFLGGMGITVGRLLKDGVYGVEFGEVAGLLAAALLGPIVLRIACEFLVVQFGIHERLAELDETNALLRDLLVEARIKRGAG